MEFKTKIFGRMLFISTSHDWRMLTEKWGDAVPVRRLSVEWEVESEEAKKKRKHALAIRIAGGNAPIFVRLRNFIKKLRRSESPAEAYIRKHKHEFNMKLGKTAA